ncbi:hypothetical protein AB0L53_46930 [Nonomuraea sp. NPDC052129]|uniref:hypothetical protein n=1 Tax=Nonomuraea sp. NPDC052129 TaxID=3154651 RepID=UPI003449EC5A
MKFSASSRAETTHAKLDHATTACLPLRGNAYTICHKAISGLADLSVLLTSTPATGQPTADIEVAVDDKALVSDILNAVFGPSRPACGPGLGGFPRYPYF